MQKSIRIFDIVIGVMLGVLIIVGYYPAFICRRYPTTYRPVVERYAEENGLSPALVFAVIKAESNFQKEARSKKGAVGLMQLRPETAEFMAQKKGYDYLDVYLTDPTYNVRTGCAYLSYLFGRFEDEDVVLASYNAGEGKVREWLTKEEYSNDGKRLTSVPFPETERYLKKVKKFKNKYKKYYSFP